MGELPRTLAACIIVQATTAVVCLSPPALEGPVLHPTIPSASHQSHHSLLLNIVLLSPTDRSVMIVTSD